jgi:hypothetical protein
VQVWGKRGLAPSPTSPTPFAAIVHVIYFPVFQNGGREGRDWYGTFCACSAQYYRTVTLLFCTHCMNSVQCNSGANYATQNVFWLANICFAFPLHKPSHKDPSHYDCGSADAKWTDSDNTIMGIFSFVINMLIRTSSIQQSQRGYNLFDV